MRETGVSEKSTRRALLNPIQVRYQAAPRPGVQEHTRTGAHWARWTHGDISNIAYNSPVEGGPMKVKVSYTSDVGDDLRGKDRSMAEHSDTRSECPRCGEWRDSPISDCASCAYAALATPAQPALDVEVLARAMHSPDAWTCVGSGHASTADFDVAFVRRFHMEHAKAIVAEYHRLAEAARLQGQPET